MWLLLHFYYKLNIYSFVLQSETKQKHLNKQNTFYREPVCILALNNNNYNNVKYLKTYLIKIKVQTFYCNFFHYHLVPLYSLPLPAITILCPCPWVLFPFCSIPPLPTSPQPLAVIMALSLSLFCLLVQFVHVREIMWYLSFSDWLFSLSMMFSSSIHAAAKGKIFFFFIAE